MKMYTDYIKERHDIESIVIPDLGFATYTIEFDEPTNTTYGFLHDLYIVPEKRGSPESAALGLQMHEIARKAGCQYSLANVDMNSAGAVRSLQFQLKMGFVPIAMNGSLITMQCLY